MTTERRLHPRERWLLTVLAQGPLHGYALIDRVEQLSEGEFALGPATLYRSLDSLAERGLIKAEPMESVGDRPRRPWRITSSGLQILRADLDFLQASLGRMRDALRGTPRSSV